MTNKEVIQSLKPLKDACDRDWKDETPQQIIAIAANAIYWRDRTIKEWSEKINKAYDNLHIKGMISNTPCYRIPCNDPQCKTHNPGEHK